ncbi:MAG: amidohydrolase [Kordiimonadaceae bacterium]|nr:amidohydrolase [Kordiimonadaceae bacterium]
MKKLYKACAYALLVTTSALTATAESANSTADLNSAVAKDTKYLESLYTYFHSHPELSLYEHKTAARLAAELRLAGYDVTEHVGGTGVVAVLKNGDGPTIMIRTDLDGLPVQEKTGVAYASTVITKDEKGKTVPVMHACGHDVHMTSLVGTARHLAALKDSWSGTLVFIGQPAEERVLGALAMLKDGLFERFPRPDYNIALHVSPTLAAGDVGLAEGYAFANVDSVDIAIKGISGHGAYPHTTKDPVVLASQIVIALQTLVSRDTSPLEAAVVTVGSFHAGTKHNIISDSAHLQITVRSYKDNVRENLISGIKRIARAQALSFGLPETLMPVVTVGESTPATYNDPALTNRIKQTLASKLGKSHVHTLGPVMGGEDFAHYGRVAPKIPSLMFRLGTVSEADMTAMKKGKRKPLSLHSSYFTPDVAPTLQTGVEATSAAVLELLNSSN